MRHIAVMLILLAFVVASPAISYDGDAESAFREGNVAFQKDDFEGAIDAYQGLIDAGYESGALYYNLGNAYYREGNIAMAILNYERAMRRMPADEDLLHNLEVARLQTIDRIEPVPRLFLWDYLRAVEDHLDISTLTATAYCGYLICLVAIALLVLSGGVRVRKYGLIACVISLLTMGMTVSMLAKKISSLEEKNHGIVVAEIADVKNAPDDEGPDIFILHSGTKVKLLDRLEEWIQIRLEDGKVGWLTADDLEII